MWHLLLVREGRRAPRMLSGLGATSPSPAEVHGQRRAGHHPACRLEPPWPARGHQLLIGRVIILASPGVPRSCLVAVGVAHRPITNAQSWGVALALTPVPKSKRCHPAKGTCTICSKSIRRSTKPESPSNNFYGSQYTENQVLLRILFWIKL